MLPLLLVDLDVLFFFFFVWLNNQSKLGSYGTVLIDAILK